MKLILSLAIILCVLKSQGQVGAGDSIRNHSKAIDTTVYTKVEIEACFVGGDMMWKRFLKKYMYSPNADDVKKIVVVKFAVDEEGETSDINIISAPDDKAYREETIRVIKKSSGYWMAAVDNGKHVRSYKTVSIEY
jgi:periplasmic protein TonB